jgi:[ribosomal protein S18]-alanine N-acetyltransferase
MGTMRFRFQRMTPALAEEVVAWRYPPPYDFYDWDPADDPELLSVPESGTLAAVDEGGTLVGFVSYGGGGQVPGCLDAGHYDDPALDIGLGLRPDLTGVGHGLDFVRAALEEGRRRYAPATFRLSVAVFNERARRVYERAGFHPGPTCLSPSSGVETQFLVMSRPATPDDEPVAKRDRGSKQDRQPADA